MVGRPDRPRRAGALHQNFVMEEREDAAQRRIRMKERGGAVRFELTAWRRQRMRGAPEPLRMCPQRLARGAGAALEAACGECGKILQTDMGQRGRRPYNREDLHGRSFLSKNDIGFQS